jgi:hypothetical protein
VRAVVLGWPDVGLTATAAATLWITPNGSIIEAWVWPPIARHGMVPARSVTAAWNQVRGGALPLAVQGINPLSHANGVGTLQATQVVSVLTARNTGTVYLVPTYRFLGTARISGAIRATWYSLAPGMSK